jgi:SAM-dependent methyltransferase
MMTESIGKLPKKLSRRWIAEGMAWRIRRLQENTTFKRLREGTRTFLGTADQHWSRVVMDRETARFVSSLDINRLDVLEISGTKWANWGFASYRSAHFPEFDLCAQRSSVSFDLIIAEQVFEHLLWPHRAAKNIWNMLNPGGVAMITTPFLIRLHNYPVDCSRWTELGLKHLLAEGGFELEDITTGAWGNRACVKANFRGWPKWNSYIHSLENEPDYPIVVWAFATKSRRLE